MSERLAPERAGLGGMTPRPRPAGGGRPAVRFVIALGLTVAYVAFSVYVSTPWRSELREAIGPVMAWVIPICLVYVPGVLVGFLASTLLTVRYLVPLLDIGYVFFWIPGVILFFAGYPLIFSWWSMLIIPITLIIYGLLRRWQERHVFRRLDVHPKQDIRGFYCYLFTYRALASPAALRGYLQYLTGAARRWT